MEVYFTTLSALSMYKVKDISLSETIHRNFLTYIRMYIYLDDDDIL